jgi:hypothetical protein
MKAKTLQADTLHDLLTGVECAIAEGLRPTLGFLFCSVSLDVEKVARALGSFAFPVFACSSCGEIQFDGHGCSVTRRSAVMALVEMPAESFQLKLFKGQGVNSCDLGRQISAWGHSVFRKPAFITVISGLTRNGEDVVRGMLSLLKEEVPLFGGLASDDAQFKETFVFTNNVYSNDGAVACVFDHARLAVDGVATSGWVGVGAPMCVTESEGNVLVSINGKPALDIYTEYLGLKAEEMPGVAVEYPLQLLAPDTSPALRTVVGVDPQRRALIFAGSIPQGSKVRFSISPGFETVENSRKDFAEFYERFQNPDLALIFSCMARLNALGPVINKEVLAVQETWQVPGVGFFCYGEFGKNTAGNTDFYNETCSLVLLNRR